MLIFSSLFVVYHIYKNDKHPNQGAYCICLRFRIAIFSFIFFFMNTSMPECFTFKTIILTWSINNLTLKLTLFLKFVFSDRTLLLRYSSYNSRLRRLLELRGCRSFESSLLVRFRRVVVPPLDVGGDSLCVESIRRSFRLEIGFGRKSVTNLFI